MTRQKSEGHLDMRKGELEEMRASILKDLQDIAAIKPEDAQNNRIMAATAEIDAIVTASERATNNFYGAAKGPQQIGAKLREPGCGTAVQLRLPQAEAPVSRDSDQPVESVNQNLNLSNLPPPDIKRWRIQHKALLVVAVRTGLINVTEACVRYRITIEEFLSWKRLLGEHGLRGLRVTRLNEYRQSASRAPEDSGHSEAIQAQGSGS